MGHHDPLDGLITYLTLQNNEQPLSGPPDLRREIRELEAICLGRDWRTTDPLGLGGLLCGAIQLAQMIAHGVTGYDEILQQILIDTLPGLTAYSGMDDLLLPAQYRLAFRELGLAIGLRAIPGLGALVHQEADMFKESKALNELLDQCSHHLPLAARIERFWLDTANQDAATWREHRDINMVMLATSLSPGTFLDV